jgi:hypothetical protein
MAQIFTALGKIDGKTTQDETWDRNAASICHGDRRPNGSAEAESDLPLILDKL